MTNDTLMTLYLLGELVAALQANDPERFKTWISRWMSLRSFLKQMDEESEFDDLELDPIALAAIAGGYGGRDGCCQEEAHDEPWGRCPGMRPMRKWLFGRQ